jgi:hypothetical protein
MQEATWYMNLLRHLWYCGVCFHGPLPRKRVLKEILASDGRILSMHACGTSKKIFHSMVVKHQQGPGQVSANECCKIRRMFEVIEDNRQGEGDFV